mgnify:CR=1 FL=1
MSANRDKSHNIRFVFSNLYQIYSTQKEPTKGALIKKGAPGNPASPVGTGPTKNQNVLKTHDLSQPGAVSVKVRSYTLSPLEPTSGTTLQDLKQDLKTLKEIQSRLRFALQDLESALPIKDES